MISDESDYNGHHMLLTFGPSSRRSEIPVAIFNDNVYELTEKFDGILSLPGNPVPGVALLPDTAQVIISDDDG